MFNNNNNNINNNNNNNNNKWHRTELGDEKEDNEDK